jgi:S1-C subfamily serine protease
MRAKYLVWPILMLLGATIGQLFAAPDATNSIIASNSVPTEIRTLNGRIYKSVRILEVKQDRLTVEFKPDSGGFGVATIQFDKLPNDLRQRYTVTPPVKKVSIEDVVKFKTTKSLAEQGDADAQYDLVRCYILGTGVSIDLNQAYEWLRKAAEKGNRNAQAWLAGILKIGYFVSEVPTIEKNPTEAARWYLRAARQGDIFSQTIIGETYAEGEGMAQDFVEGYKWLNIAGTTTEDDEAKEWLAQVKTPTPQQIEDLKFFNIIAANNAEHARKARDKLAERMTSGQIAEGQRRATGFKSRKESGDSASTSTENPTASGTGFFVSNDGYLVTNEHVVEGASKIRLVTSAGLISAKVVKVDSANDLALLKAEGKFSSLPIISSRSAKLGNTVATVGFPNIGLQGFAPKLAKGEIASLSGASDDARYFQISVPVQPGNSGLRRAVVVSQRNSSRDTTSKINSSTVTAASSTQAGGALVDERGNVVGIVSAKLNASAALAASGVPQSGMNYAVKSSFLLSFLESVPAVSAKLKSPNTVDEKFSDVVKSAQDAAVLVLVY